MGVVVRFNNKKDSANASIDPLLELVKEDMSRVNEAILLRAKSHVDMIPELAHHLINSGGKRLRPMLTIAAAQMCGYDGDAHIKLATSVEFMHTATLLHDDVVDESDLRRGKKTARLIWGNQASVLVGDYLLGQAFKMMVETGSLEALGILSDASSIIAEGEVLQLAAANNTATTEDAYMQVIDAKTAALFAAAAEVGGVVAERPDEEKAALASYGRNLGIAFQLVDDALDYSGKEAEIGKTVGDDFREGKMTLPVLRAYEAAQEKNDEIALSFWKRVIADHDQRDADLEHAITLLSKENALEATLEAARIHSQSAIDALDVFENGPWKSALIDLAAFVVDRVN